MKEEDLVKYHLVDKGKKLNFVSINFISLFTFKDNFNFLKKSKCSSVKAIDDEELYDEVVSSF